ncbi:unnamed protein product [Oreochromis niloticus]|nr:unnamed protein product [Mustela putorius furo]
MKKSKSAFQDSPKTPRNLCSNIDQDFTMLFVGEGVSAKFLAKWPTKPRIIKDCKNLSQSTELDELLISAQRYSDEGGKFWDCEAAASFCCFTCYLQHLREGSPQRLAHQMLLTT